MVVDRWTFSLKVGAMADARELIVDEAKKCGPPHDWRVYVPRVGARDVLAVEFEFCSTCECEEWWTEWLETSEAADYLQVLYGLLEPGTTREIWKLAET